jgi:hypothetical protein
MSILFNNHLREMNLIESCLVVPFRGAEDDVQASSSSMRKGTYVFTKVGCATGSGTEERQVEELWEFTSADVLTLEKGFALDTCW